MLNSILSRSHDLWSNEDEIAAVTPSNTDLLIKFGQISNNRNNSDAFLKGFAGLVGGSFMHSFSSLLPTVVGNRTASHYFMPREKLSAESLHKWMLMIPPTQVKVYVAAVEKSSETKD